MLDIAVPPWQKMHLSYIFSVFVFSVFIFAAGTMRLTVQTDYSLRMLMYLATMQRRGTIQEIAVLFGISTHHVAKVANQLARWGFVRSIRGLGGGVELARPAEEISVGDVIAQCEGNNRLLECISLENVCAIQSFCKLKGVLAQAEQVQMNYLNSVSLADIIPRKR